MDKKQRHIELADFLKKRRANILPEQVGLTSGGRRRTPGLRREEVAQLAGVGLTWYTWLEQGRPIRVSAQVLDSLSRVLLLDRHERTHLYELALEQQPTDVQLYKAIGISAVVQHVLESLTISPAFVMDQRWNVIAWNQAAVAVFGDYGSMNARDRNIVWMMFTNESYRSLFEEWEYHARGMLARFRLSCGQMMQDPWLLQFIDDLKDNSGEFSLWWSQHEVHGNSDVQKKLNHLQAGKLVFEFSSFDLSDSPGLRMVVNTPDPATDTAVRMQQLLDC